MTKRLFALLLSLVLVFTLLPLGAVAEGTSAELERAANVALAEDVQPEALPEEEPAETVTLEEQTVEDTVCNVAEPAGTCVHTGEGWVAYGSGEGESTKLPQSGKIYLTHDINLSGVVMLDKATYDLSICLNGYTITAPANNRHFRMANDAKLHIYDCGDGKITGGACANNGGMLYADGANTEVHIHGGTITGNQSSGSGGAIFALGGPAVYVYEGAVFTKNKAQAEGGAMYIGRGCSLTATGGDFTYNEAGTLAGGILFNGTAAEPCSGTVANASFDHNTATGNGGVLRAGTAVTLNISNTSFTNNSTNGYGGALHLEGAVQATLTAVTVQNNSASTANKGGGICHYGNASSSVVLGGKCVITDNTSGNVANNIFLAAGRTMKANSLSKDSAIGLSITDASGTIVTSGINESNEGCFVSDKSTGEYDLYARNGALVLGIPVAEHPVEGYGKCGHDDENTQWIAWTDSSKMPSTTGHYVLNCNVTQSAAVAVTSAQDIVVCLNGNTVKATSGRIYRLSNGAKVTICDCTATTDANGNYTAGKLIPGPSKGGVAGLFKDGTDTNTGTSFTMYDGIIDGTGITNTGNGGAICGESTVASVQILGGVIKNCTAVNGGAIYAVGTGLTVENATITGNKNTGTGASAIYCGQATATIGEGTVITGNISTGSNADWRGAVYTPNANGKLVFKGNVIVDDNYVNDGKIERNVYLQANTALLNVNALTQGAKLGVTTRTAVPQVIGKNVTLADPTAYIFSDEGHNVVLAGGELKIEARAHDAHGDDSCGHNNVTWSKWSTNNNLPTAEGHYYLATNVTISSATGVSYNSGKEITICLNGYTVNGNATGRIFRISNGTIVNICDCSGHGTITNGKNNKGSVAWLGVDSATEKKPALNLYGGTLTGNTSAATGADASVIAINAGTFSMHGGKITENPLRAVLVKGNDAAFALTGGEISNNTFTGTEGTAIRVDSGKFTMSGGKVTGNAGTIGVGLRQAGGTVSITGGEFSGNTGKGGGGLFVAGGTLTVTDVKIFDNVVTEYGGGVYVNGGTVTLGSGVTITGNEAANGGGLRIGSAASNVTLNGVTITGNTATTNDGGVSFSAKGATGDKLTLSGTTVIADNSAGTSVNNINLLTDMTVALDKLEEGAKIGVSVNLDKLMQDGQVVVSAAASEGDDAFFTSDQAHVFVVKDGKLYLTLDPAAVHVPHEDDECGHDTVEWKYWTDANALPTQAGHWYLMTDVNLKDGVTVSTAEEITLCLNGFNVTQTVAGDFNRIYRLSGGAVLNLCDCKAHTDSNGNYVAGKLTGGNASGGVSAVYAADEGTVFRMYDGIITGNSTEANCGAVGIMRSALFEMHGGEIRDNTCGGNGGGIYVSEATVKLLGGKISGNTATGEGGGVYAATSTVELDGTKVTGNTSKAGGGFVIGKKTKMTFASGEITYNTSNNGGGVVVQSEAELTMKDGRIYKNKTVSGNGGGVYVSRDGTFNMKGGTVSGNTSKKTGGGLYIADKANIYGGSITGNHAGKEGGGIYITESTWEENGVKKSSDGVVNMYGGTVSYNTTDVSAGGVLVRGQKGVFNLRGGSITGNRAMVQKSGCGHGGGIIAQGKGNIYMYGGTISNNECYQTGGGIRSASNATVKLYGGTITGNKAYRGAGVYLDSTGLIDGVTITKNTAQFEGAGLYVTTHEVTMTSGKIVENEVTDGNGGGICLRAEAIMNYKGGSIEKNRAPEGHGGGVLIQSSAKLIMTGGTINENYAQMSGGGIRSSRCEVQVLGGQVSGNVCDMTGGGIFGETTLILKDCEISNNRITGDKGGTTAGGGIYLANVTQVDMENVKLINNYALGKAGGINIGYRCDVNMRNCQITGNTASGNGGGVVIWLYAKARIENSNISDNNAIGQGGGVFVEADSKLELINCELRNNSAGKEGGALNVKTKSVGTLDGCLLEENKSGTGGSAIYANGGVYLTDTTITGNADKKGGCAVILDNLDHDNESYIPSVNQFRGEVIISGNDGGDLQLINDGFVNIYGDGLTGKSEIGLLRPEGGVTKWVIGPYDYVRNGDVYTITPGDLSLKVADPETPAEEVPEQTTEPEVLPEEPPVDDNTARNTVLIAFGGVLVLAAILAVVAVLVWRKKKAKK